jgi:hypothetical protein
MDEQLIGMVDLPVPRKHQRINGNLFMTLERADMSIRYRPVQFSDPDETLMLPAEITSSSMWRNGGSAGSRVDAIVQQLSALRDSWRILR